MALYLVALNGEVFKSNNQILYIYLKTLKKTFMNYYAISFLVLNFISLLVSANVHGKPRTGNYSFWITLMGVISNVCLLLGALGYFNF